MIIHKSALIRVMAIVTQVNNMAPWPLVLVQLCYLFCRTEEMLNHAWISYNIAADLFGEMLEEYKYKNGLCVRTFSIFVMAIALYDFLFEKRGSVGQGTQHKNEHSHLIVLQKQRENYITWLKSKPVHSDINKYFKVHVK